MQLTIRFLIIQLLVTINYAAAIPEADPKNADETKNRVMDKDLSEHEHYINSQHNAEYDHEAFLGEEAKTFDQLTPEESTRRLGLIVEKIDNDKDGFVTKEELKDWIKYSQKRYIRDNVDRQWKSQNPEEKEKIYWVDYRKSIYGFLDDTDSYPADKQEEFKVYAKMESRERRRWTIADVDGDDALTKEEFAGFIHPEETDHMKDIVVIETMEDVDKDGDGKISLTEYIVFDKIHDESKSPSFNNDIYRGDKSEELPEWVKSEEENFSTRRDKDGDGFMNAEEVKNWIIPADYDHAEAEARHLIYEADSDADQKLTREEILEKYDIFVGSQATDFGEALARHDEF